MINRFLAAMPLALLAALLAAAPNGAAATELLATNFTSGVITSYDASGAVLNPALVTSPLFPYSLAVSGNDLYVLTVTSGGVGTVAEYDVNTGAPINTCADHRTRQHTRADRGLRAQLVRSRQPRRDCDDRLDRRVRRQHRGHD